MNKTVFLTTGLLGQWQPYSFDNSKWLEHDYGYNSQLYKQIKIVNPPLEWHSKSWHYFKSIKQVVKPPPASVYT